MKNGAQARSTAARRQRWIDELGAAASWWGETVPDDPGIGELAELFDLAADRHGPGPGGASGELLAAAESLKAAARLGGSMPEVVLWHLRRAVEQQRCARPVLGAVHAAG